MSKAQWSPISDNPNYQDIPNFYVSKSCVQCQAKNDFLKDVDSRVSYFTISIGMCYLPITLALKFEILLVFVSKILLCVW